MRSLLFSSLLLASTFGFAPEASACSCLPPSVESSYFNSDHTVFGRVVSMNAYGNWHAYRVEVLKDFRDAQPAGTVVTVVTSASTASCGTSLQIGQRYVLFANDANIGGAPRWSTNSCLGNMPISQLTVDERLYLRSREVLNPNGSFTCADTTIPLVNCFADPCSVTPACPGAVCSANYCGGCNAEFYDSFGYPACTPWP